MAWQLWFLICGVATGIANVIPGVSGGTILVVLGVFEKCVRALATFHLGKPGFLFTKEAWGILLWVGCGAAVGIFGAARLMEFLLLQYPLFTFSFLFGLIASSIVFIVKSVDWKVKIHGLWLLYGFVCLLLLLILSQNILPDSNGNVDSNAFRLFIGGFIGAVIMMLPGISGSMMLLVLGLYSEVLHVVSSFDFFGLIFLSVGVGTGIVFASKLLSLLFKRFKNQTYLFILGLMLASLYPLWKINFGEPFWGILFAFVFMVAGFLFGFVLVKMGEKQKSVGSA